MARDKSGKAFERAVARIQQKLDPNSMVTHDEKLVDRVGNERQYDVVIRGQFAGYPMLGVVECKDHRRRKGPSDVEAFAKKTENLGANFRMMVSRSGFTQQALAVAAHEHILCFTPLLDDPDGITPEFGVRWYARFYRWKSLNMTIKLKDRGVKIGAFDANEVTLDGKRVIEYFTNQLVTAHEDTRVSSVRMMVNFKEPRLLVVNGRGYAAKWITVIAHREMLKKTRWVRFTGEAMYDWASKRATVPANTPMLFMPFTSGMEGWEDYDGDIDAQLTNLRGSLVVCCFVVSEVQFAPSPDAIDLGSY